MSESHLDTLGVCLWLAITRHHSKGEAIVVLDDVFATADAHHQQRMLRMLAEESSSFRQVILTTHSTLLRDHFHSDLNGDANSLVKLGAWSLTDGIQVVG